MGNDVNNAWLGRVVIAVDGSSSNLSWESAALPISMAGSGAAESIWVGDKDDRTPVVVVVGAAGVFVTELADLVFSP